MKEDLGFETDEEYNQSIDNDKTTEFLKKKKSSSNEADKTTQNKSSNEVEKTTQNKSSNEVDKTAKKKNKSSSSEES